MTIFCSNNCLISLFHCTRRGNNIRYGNLILFFSYVSACLTSHWIFSMELTSQPEALRYPINLHVNVLNWKGACGRIQTPFGDSAADANWPLAAFFQQGILTSPRVEHNSSLRKGRYLIASWELEGYFLARSVTFIGISLMTGAPWFVVSFDEDEMGEKGIRQRCFPRHSDLSS
jgi:hypothetical protein